MIKIKKFIVLRGGGGFQGRRDGERLKEAK